MLPQTHQVGPPMACKCGACTLRLGPSALISDCGAQIMVTLHYSCSQNDLFEVNVTDIVILR